MNAWIDDPNMWIRRVAILSQLRHKAETDEAQLFRYCLGRAHEKEFFIRKAIGWSLRDYAHAAPERVRAFLAAHEGALSGLSRREAAKHL
jgi:3-methyladenine DNA glycosylase AlkD